MQNVEILFKISSVKNFNSVVDTTRLLLFVFLSVRACAAKQFIFRNQKQVIACWKTT